MLKTNMKTNNIGIEQDVAVSIYCMQKLPFFVEKCEELLQCKTYQVFSAKNISRLEFRHINNNALKNWP